MKFLKNIFLFLLILSVGGAMYLASIDGLYNVKKSIIIKAKPEVIFNDLNDFKNWIEWSPRYDKDSLIQVTYFESTEGVGGSYSWTSEHVRDGFMITLKTEKPKSLDQQVTIKSIFGEIKSDVYWKLDPVGDGTKVTWGMKGDIGFFNRFMIKEMVNEFEWMEERGLELLDLRIQKKLEVFTIENLGVVDYSGGFYLYVSTSSKINEIDSKLPIMLVKISDFIESNNIRTTGSPFTIYHKIDQQNNTTMFSVCIPIPERIMTPKGNDILTGFIESGKYFKTILNGSHKNSKLAWDKAMIGVEDLLDYVELENGELIEVYVNSILTTPNPADLLTEIYIPVKKVKAID